MSEPVQYTLPTFTKPELEFVLELFDLGVKSAGLRVAGNAAHLYAKINQAKPVPAAPVVDAPPHTGHE